MKGWLQGLDAVVLGSGLVGSSAALRLRERFPSWRIAVLDRSRFGGASTRNAGFACFGSPSELLDDWRNLGPQATVDLVRMRWEGLRSLRQRWGDEALGYRACGAREAFTDAELFTACEIMLPELNEALHQVFGEAPFRKPPLPSPGLKNVCGVLESSLEGDLDTAQLALTLERALREANVAVLSGVDVQLLERTGAEWLVQTPQGGFKVPHVVVATNAWARELLDVNVSPVPNHVVVSQPLPHLDLKHTVHHDRGYVYAREVDGRLLIGGGRQWDCDSDEDRVDRLIAWAQNHISGAEAWRTEHHWVGQLGIGDIRQPVIRKIEPGLVAGVRMGGMGVAIGTQVGQQLADLV